MRLTSGQNPAVCPVKSGEKGSIGRLQFSSLDFAGYLTESGMSTILLLPPTASSTPKSLVYSGRSRRGQDGGTTEVISPLV